MWRFATLLHFDHEEYLAWGVAGNYGWFRKDGRVDVLQADVLDGEGEFFPRLWGESVERWLRNSVGCVYADDQHSSLRVRERGDDFWQRLSDVPVECAFVFDADAFVEPGTEVANVLNGDWPLGEKHGGPAFLRVLDPKYYYGMHSSPSPAARQLRSRKRQAR